MVYLRDPARDQTPSAETPREWLVANGLGGYASATIAGVITRRYHGFLIAALPSPLGRMVLLNDLEVDIERLDGSVVNMRENGRFVEFTLNVGLPRCRYELDGVVIEKSIVVPSRQNIVHVTFRLIGDGRRVRLRLRPFINFRPLEASVSEAVSPAYSLTVQGHRYESAPARIFQFCGLPFRAAKIRPLPLMGARAGSSATRSRRSAVTNRTAGCGPPATLLERLARITR
jgi:glycogen debranching enzyme